MSMSNETKYGANPNTGDLPPRQCGKNELRSPMHNRKSFPGFSADAGANNNNNCRLFGPRNERPEPEDRYSQEHLKQ